MSRRAAENRTNESSASPGGNGGTPDSDSTRQPGRFPAYLRWSLILLTVAAAGAMVRRPLEHQLRCLVANTYANTACARAEKGERHAALRAVEKALAWLPGDAALIYLRAQIHAHGENWEASLADYSEVAERLAPNFAAAYARRAEVHRLSANFHQAIDDLDRAIELSPQPDTDLLNERAYMRALADTDLETALEEIELALELLSQHNDADDLKLQREAAYFDTRGYIQFRLQKYESALGDIERALRTLQVDRDRKLKMLTEARRPPGDVMRAYDKVQAEIVYHRGEIRQALGQQSKADDDFALARDLGYTPPDSR